MSPFNFSRQVFNMSQPEHFQASSHEGTREECWRAGRFHYGGRCPLQGWVCLGCLEHQVRSRFWEIYPLYMLEGPAMIISLKHGSWHTDSRYKRGQSEFKSGRHSTVYKTTHPSLQVWHNITSITNLKSLRWKFHRQGGSGREQGGSRHEHAN